MFNWSPGGSSKSAISEGNTVSANQSPALKVFLSPSPQTINNCPTGHNCSSSIQRILQKAHSLAACIMVSIMYDECLSFLLTKDSAYLCCVNVPEASRSFTRHPFWQIGLPCSSFAWGMLRMTAKVHDCFTATCKMLEELHLCGSDDILRCTIDHAQVHRISG